MISSSNISSRIAGRRVTFPGPFKTGDVTAPFRGQPHEHRATESLDRRLRVLLALESDITGPHILHSPHRLRREIGNQANYMFSEIGPGLAYSLFESFGDFAASVENPVTPPAIFRKMTKAIRLSEDILFLMDKESELEFLGIPLIGMCRGYYLGFLGSVILGNHNETGRRFFTIEDTLVMRGFSEIVSTAMVSSELGIPVLLDEAFQDTSRLSADLVKHRLLAFRFDIQRRLIKARQKLATSNLHRLKMEIDFKQK